MCIYNWKNESVIGYINKNEIKCSSVYYVCVYAYVTEKCYPCENQPQQRQMVNIN